jgi:hypothetical protein
MKAKFEIGQKVMFLGTEQTIKVVKKDFATGEISYRLVDESLAKENELFPIQESKKGASKKEPVTESEIPEFLKDEEPVEEQDEELESRPKIQRKK